MTVLIPLERGRAVGRLYLTSFEKLEIGHLLEIEPEIAKELEDLRKEVTEKNWKLDYSDHLAMLSGELHLNNIEYQLMSWSLFKSNYSMMIDIGTVLPVVKEIKLSKLIYNIQTDKMTHDNISIDLVRKEITHVNDIFWNWEEGWEKDPEKLLEAFETLKVLRWLIEEKGYSLKGEPDVEKYRKIRESLESSGKITKSAIDYNLANLDDSK